MLQSTVIERQKKENVLVTTRSQTLVKTELEKELNTGGTIILEDPVARLDDVELEEIAENTELRTKKTQPKYVDYFNHGTKFKQFAEGDQVIVLAPDSSNKLFARWQGPVSVLGRVKQNSYRVEMPNQGIKTFHASRLRPFKVDCLVVGVVFQDDVDFGDILEKKGRSIKGYV